MQQYRFANDRHLQLKNPVIPFTCVKILIVAGLSSYNQTFKDSYLACETVDGKHYRVTGIPNYAMTSKKKSIVDGMIELDLPEGAYFDKATATLK